MLIGRVFHDTRVLEIATSAHKGLLAMTYFFDGRLRSRRGLPRQSEDWLAMTVVVRGLAEVLAFTFLEVRSTLEVKNLYKKRKAPHPGKPECRAFLKSALLI